MRPVRIDLDSLTAIRRIRPGQQFQVEARLIAGEPAAPPFKGEAFRDPLGGLWFKSTITPDPMGLRLVPEPLCISDVGTLFLLDPLASKTKD